ncbi:YqeG family HAD IIIA-type phosphatase [Thermanaerosceptrum fracticalcis]|uniref:YqeG family HAD IIIA-type phosphatase n=1 Tax=Thermanaerosceptrum fracticalcis TaxID=1712410 RepID=A0A7G6E099_THEFR|nr:YqeG family HAD IIIA-type phosphatase [Thermanaerosceptrum fracticalcis]QNB45503.1 YqeG family HAD IIIA-type phosphatase [Thermanaerosceptrum fracticalcis]
MRYFQPAEISGCLASINLKKLWDMGKRGIILDLDNTITPWRTEEITAEADTFIRSALNLGFSLCLLSNATRSRAKKIADFYQLPFLAPALKPCPLSFKIALKILQLPSAQVVVVGDQIFTDILGGNLVKCYTILVPPLLNKEFIGTRFMRFLERKVMRRNL